MVLFIPAIVPAAGTASPNDELLRAESSRDDRRCGTPVELRVCFEISASSSPSGREFVP